MLNSAQTNSFNGFYSAYASVPIAFGWRLSASLQMYLQLLAFVFCIALKLYRMFALDQPLILRFFCFALGGCLWKRWFYQIWLFIHLIWTHWNFFRLVVVVVGGVIEVSFHLVRGLWQRCRLGLFSRHI